MFVYVKGVTGRLGFAFLAQRVGRRVSGQLMGYGAAIALGIAAIFHADFLGPVLVFPFLSDRRRADLRWRFFKPRTLPGESFPSSTTSRPSRTSAVFSSCLSQSFGGSAGSSIFPDSAFLGHKKEFGVHYGAHSD